MGRHWASGLWTGDSFLAETFVQMSFVPVINYGESTDICQHAGLRILVLQK